MSSHGTPAGSARRPNLRLFAADPTVSGDGGLSGRMRLSEFFATWFLVIVLEGEGRDAATITSYRESIEWWCRITGDPPLDEVDEFVIAKFKSELRSSTYRRGPAGQARTLGAYTQGKHLKQVRAVLRRAGPTTNPSKPGKSLIAETPHISVAKPKRQLPKRPFQLDDARAIVAAAATMPPPRWIGKWGCNPSAWWRAFLLTLYYTGLRTGTVLQLRVGMIEARSDGHLLRIPGAIVDKTEKPLEKFLHPLAVAAIRELRTTDLIFPWPHWRRHINDRHDALQGLAGIAEEKRLSPHAWRRTHSTQMALLGAHYGMKVAQHTLDHADDRTTSAFYVDIEAMLIAQLPPIDTLRKPTKQLQLF